VTEPGADRLPVERVTLDQVVRACDDLAGQVRCSGWRPELVVCIARGGLVPARFLCDFLGLSRLYCIQVRHYAAGARALRRAEVVAPLPLDLAGAAALLVDDVNDSGDTFAAAVPHLRARGAGELRTAVIHEKAGTAFAADFKSLRVTEWHWILYPWAQVEDVGDFLRALQPAPRSRAAAAAALRERHGLVLDQAELDRVLRCNGLDLP
jgi:hypoxanthine phosphoribosyltransferase